MIEIDEKRKLYEEDEQRKLYVDESGEKYYVITSKKFEKQKIKVYILLHKYLQEDEKRDQSYITIPRSATINPNLKDRILSKIISYRDRSDRMPKEKWIWVELFLEDSWESTIKYREYHNFFKEFAENFNNNYLNEK